MFVVRQSLSVESFGLEAQLKLRIKTVLIWVFFPFPVQGMQAVLAGQSYLSLAMLCANGRRLGALLHPELLFFPAAG